MNKPPYRKQPGDYEIRVLKDSRLVLIGPDQELIDLAQSMCQLNQRSTDKESSRKDAKDAKK